MRALIILPAILSLSACSSLTPVDDPVYLRVTDLEARLLRIENMLENEGLVALATDLSSLRTEVQQLLGEVETLNFELENERQGNQDLYLDLDQRLAALEQAGPLTAPAGAEGGAGTVFGGSVTAQQAYDAAFSLIEQRDYAAAQAAFETFLATYPDSPLRANAQYWLAETHYAQLSFATALPEFQQVVTEYPESSKLPDALLKIGFCNYELRNFDAARQALLRVTREFPGTTFSNLAEERLAMIARETG